MRTHGFLLILGLLAVFLIGAAAARASAEDAGAEAFVSQLFSGLATAMAAPDEATRVRSAGDLISDATDMTEIARSSAGPLWATGTAADRAMTERLLLGVLAGRTASGANVLRATSIAVLGQGTSATGASVVATEARRTGYVPVRIDWHVRAGPAGYRIEDVIIEGLSARALLRLATARLANQGTTLAALNESIASLASPDPAAGP